MKKIFTLIITSLLCAGPAFSIETTDSTRKADNLYPSIFNASDSIAQQSNDSLMPKKKKEKKVTKHAGKVELFNFGVEAGVYVLTKDITPPKEVHILENALQGYYIPWHIGAIGEFLLGNGMFGLATGVRITPYNASLGVIVDDRHYYNWDVSTTDDVELVTLYKIKQLNNYVGVPLQFRIFFVPYDKIVRPYFKLDMAFNWNVSTKTTVHFKNEADAATYEKRIIEQIGTPEKFNSTLDFAYGLRIGKEPVFVNAEIHFPSFLLTDSPISYFSASDLTMLNFGVKVAVQVPVWWTDYVDKKNGKTVKGEQAQKDEMIQNEYIPQYDIEQQPAEDDSNGEFTPQKSTSSDV